MAIYRPPKPRWRTGVLGALVGLLIGGVIGFTMGAPNEPDLDEAVGAIRAAMARAAGSLEVAAIEYEEAVENGEVLRQSEYDGSLSAVDSSQAAYRDVRAALAALDPDKARTIDEGYAALVDAMEEYHDPAEVADMAGELEDLLKE